MARGGRRLTRLSNKPEDLPLPEFSHSPSNHSDVKETEDSCPACSPNTLEEHGDEENWIGCEICKTWFHWRCVGNGEKMEAINTWYCDKCLKEDASRAISLKAPARKSPRKRTQPDYANLNSGLQSDHNRWMRLIDSRTVPDANFKTMKGSEVGLEWLNSDNNAMREPVIIESMNGLGMKMPHPDLSIRDIAESLGEDTPVEVIDVASQSNSPGWTLGKWAEYYEIQSDQRDKIRNVISLEISGTKLADQVLPPRIVRELDWVEKFWPNKSRGKGQYPKVQLYCLMGVANAYTDWHIDFAGSSVYYHILRGSKVFYFIRPTPSNLAAYERWSGSDLQNQRWLGDMVDGVVKVTLRTGNTMIIPTGWIHAVYTPIDSLVFGGNFLHSFNIDTQLKIREIEIATRVPKKFCFPLFVKLCWYVGEKYLRDLKSKEEFPQRVLDGIESLARFLVTEVRTMERGTDQARREAKEHVPADRVKDPAALARELRWRAQSAAGHLSDDEGANHPASHDERATFNGHVGDDILYKRKRKSSPLDEQSIHDNKRNFKPRLWEAVKERPVVRDSRVLRAQKPVHGVDWTDTWINKDDVPEDADGEEVDVKREQHVTIKVRSTVHGLERQRIERVVEEWVWT